jgi:DNA mismatch endonuclease, patch repair protein
VKLAVFVDGCFWHGCAKCRDLPATNVEFWRAKIKGNRKRDRRVSRRLRRAGWTVVRIRECAIQRASTLQSISAAIEMARERLVV